MIRRLTIAALIGTAVIAIPAAPAQAYARCPADAQCVITFYTNVQHTTAVGGIEVFCDGTRSTWGVLSGIVVESSAACD